MPGLSINGSPLSDYGMSLRDWGGVYSRASVGREFTAVPSMLGAYPIQRALGSPKAIPLSLVLKGVTPSTRRAALDAVLLSLSGLLECEWDDATDRVMWGLLDAAQIRNRFNLLAFSDGPVHIDCDLVIPWGVSIAKQPTVLELVANTRVALPGGTVPSPLFVHIPGSATTPTLTYRGADGRTREVLALTGSPGATTTLRIETGPWRIVAIDETTGAETLVNGDYFDATLVDGAYASGGYPLLDPRDGSGAANPTLESDSEGYVIYWKAYE